MKGDIMKKKVTFISLIALLVVGIALLILPHSLLSLNAEGKKELAKVEAREIENLHDKNPAVVENTKNTEDSESEKSESKEERLKLWNTSIEQYKKEKDALNLNTEKVNKWIHETHSHVDMAIIFAYQEGLTFEDQNQDISSWALAPFVGLKWIQENYDFESQFHRYLINDIIYFLEKFAKGDNDALFSLKNVVYELDLELNPELYQPQRASYLSLLDIERIKNGEGPAEYLE